MSALAAALIAELDDDALERLTDLLTPRVAARIAGMTPTQDGWLDSTRAAEYLGISRASLHKKTAAREIAFEQDGPGCKCWFRRQDLDAWRRGTNPDAAKTQPRRRFTGPRAA
jgi:excisionase family DNA binding protein